MNDGPYQHATADRVVTVRMPTAAYRTLSDLAIRDDRSVSSLIRVLVRRYLAEQAELGEAPAT